MRRIVAILAAAILLIALAAPSFAADGTSPGTGRVLIGIGGDVSLPAGEQADTVLVINGNATVEGTATAVVVIDGTATVTGATIEDLVVVSGTAAVTDSEVRGDIRTLDAQVTQTDVRLGGTVRGLEQDIAGMAWFVGVSALLIWVGFGLATLVAGMLVAGLAGRQVRATAALIRQQPGTTILAGIAGLVIPPLLGVLLAITIIGLPLSFAMFVVVWPMLAFLGYLVAAVWVGEWLLKVLRGTPDAAERPYLATFVGLVALFVVGFIPLVTAILSFLGFGAVLLACWRVLRREPGPAPIAHPSPVAVAG